MPDAATLIKYKSVIIVGADGIIKIAEKQQHHSMSIESLVIKSQSGQSSLGQWLGFIIGITGIGCGTFLAFSGETTAGGSIAGGTVVS